MLKWFDKSGNVKRRGGILPGRLRNASRRGVTLVELMISMLILAIVCISWLQIIGIQSARKEARRREAVERLAGMMDAFMYMGRSGKIGGKSIVANRSYVMCATNYQFYFERSGNENRVEPLFDEIDKGGVGVSSIGYRLFVTTTSKLDESNKFGDNWKPNNYSIKWLVGELYDHSDCMESEAGRPFFSLPVCLGL